MSDRLFIHFAAQTPGAEARGVYRLADRTLITRPALPAWPALERFRVPAPRSGASGPSRAEPGSGSAPAGDTFVRRVTGIVAGRERTVECRSLAGGGFRLRIEGVGTFRVTRRNGEAVIDTDLEPTEPAVASALGPALALALAWDGVWVLHASAALRGGRVFGFVGPGGIGKSTLVRHLGARPGGRWRPIADDLLPVRLARGRLEALLRYPQPRWSGRPEATGPATGRKPDAPPESAPVDSLFRLGRPEPAGAPDGAEPDPAAPACRRLAGREAAAALIDQTVCASLFDATLLERQLEFCGRVAETVPVLALTYPLEVDRLAEVEQLLESRARGVRGEAERP